MLNQPEARCSWDTPSFRISRRSPRCLEAGVGRLPLVSLARVGSLDWRFGWLGRPRKRSRQEPTWSPRVRTRLAGSDAINCKPHGQPQAFHCRRNPPGLQSCRLPLSQRVPGCPNREKGWDPRFTLARGRVCGRIFGPSQEACTFCTLTHEGPLWRRYCGIWMVSCCESLGWKGLAGTHRLPMWMLHDASPHCARVQTG